MTKVFPAIVPANLTAEPTVDDFAVFTVWKKSLLLNCSGFTVFDGTGSLVYRVDTYAAGNKRQILLMDADGKPILTMRRKRLSLGENWKVYEGEKKTDPIFSVHRNFFFRSKTVAHVSACETTSFPGECKIEGSYRKRSVSVFDGAKRCLAEIRRKETASGVALGVDVFRLIVTRSRIDTAPAMALVVLLDRMFGSLPSSNSGRYISC